MKSRHRWSTATNKWSHFAQTHAEREKVREREKNESESHEVEQNPLSGYKDLKQISCKNLGFLWYSHFNFRQNGNTENTWMHFTSGISIKVLCGIFASETECTGEKKCMEKLNIHLARVRSLARSLVCWFVGCELLFTQPTCWACCLLAEWLVYVECHCNLFVCDCTLETRLVNADFCICK